MQTNDTPERCKSCAKYHNPSRYHIQCETCQGLGIEEGLFCDLNREVQDRNRFMCSAFEPKLNVVKSIAKPKEILEQQLNKPLKAQHINILISDKIQYQGALALQKLKRDPDTVFMQIKYHFAWNVKYRKPLFKSDKNMIETTNRLFSESSQVVKDFVTLISLAPEHVHVLVESNGKLSVEKLISRIKEFTGNGLIREYPELKELTKNDSIWDDAYIAETIG